jgi:hypothetical protein
MKKKALILGLLILSMMISSCVNRDSYSSATDGKISVMAIKNQREGIVKVRVIFKDNKQILDPEQFSSEMQYDVDSCFYMDNGKKRIYPIYITPIASGLDKTFEYIVGFEKEELKSGALVYFDRHLSKKKIALTFK